MARRTSPCVVCGAMECAMCFAGDPTCSDTCHKRAVEIAEVAPQLIDMAQVRLEVERRRDEIRTEDLWTGVGKARGGW